MTNLNHYLEAFKKLSEEDQNNILNDLFQVKKKLEEQQGSQVWAIFKNLNERPAWKNLEAMREELISILALEAMREVLISILTGQKKNDSTTVDPEIIGSQDALDEVNNELQKSEDKADIIGDAIEKKLLWPSPHALTDAHPKIKEAINSWEIKVYVKQSDWWYMLGDEKFTKEKAHALMWKESLYAITEECDYRDGKKRTATTIFARKNIEWVDWIKRAFELQGNSQTHYTNKKELTEQWLKPLFVNYKDRTEYTYLFNQPDWLNLDSNAKQELQKLVMEINLPKTGYQDSDGERRWFAKYSYLWLPLCFSGEQVCLWSDDSDASFYYWDGSVARPVYTFTN